jgi:hypothetical protein
MNSTYYQAVQFSAPIGLVLISSIRQQMVIEGAAFDWTQSDDKGHLPKILE